MKITESQLRRIIKEEIEKLDQLDEGWFDDVKSRLGFGGKSVEDRPSRPSTSGVKSSKSMVAEYLKKLETVTSIQAAMEIIRSIGDIDPKLQEPLARVAQNFKDGMKDVVSDAVNTIRGSANVKEGFSRERNRNLPKRRQKRL